MDSVISTRIVKEPFVAEVVTLMDSESDGFKYKCMQTGYESTSNKLAINNAMAFLGKQWAALQKKVGKTKREIEIKVPNKTLTEIRNLEKAQSIPKKRRIFTIKDDEEYNAEKLRLEHLKAIRKPRTRSKEPIKLTGVKRARTKPPIKKVKVIRVRTKKPVKKQQDETLANQLKYVLERRKK